jgi:hypothetical protein
MGQPAFHQNSEDQESIAVVAPESSVGELERRQGRLQRLITPLRQIRIASLVAWALLVTYAVAFYNSISEYWFSPVWTTDDAVQQLYPFHEVTYPGIFAGDLITDVMKGYLAPAHYWLSYGITMLTHDPIMTGHWVMLIQLALTAGFLFAVVRHAGGFVPACLSVLWLLQSRNLIQRLTCGLPRGWSAPLFTAFLYFAMTRRDAAVLVTILLGCLLNPPATLVIGLAYGGVLVWRWAFARSGERRAAFRTIMVCAFFAPLFAVITLVVVHRPPEVGQMVTYQQAEQMPEFSRPDGRFPFVPFDPVEREVKMFAFDAFIGRFAKLDPTWKSALPTIMCGLLLAIAITGAIRKRWSVPVEVWIFGGAALCVYALSRMLAFQLYVPNRHLQIPLNIFFIAAFCIGGWRAFHRAPSDAAPTNSRDGSLRVAWPSIVALGVIAAIVYSGSGVRLTGTANFNYRLTSRGKVFAWLRENTPEHALIAGEPTHLDPVQLFARRRGYVTTETTHPFYQRYYAELKRRYEIALRAHFSQSLEELVALLEPEGIDYFVFRREDFYPQNLASLKYFAPFDTLAKEFSQRPLESLVYKQLPSEVSLSEVPFVPFVDGHSKVVDVRALSQYLKSRGRTVQAATRGSTSRDTFIRLPLPSRG